MSVYIQLNMFSGKHSETAVNQLTKIFRMAPQEANIILKDLQGNRAWKFPSLTSDIQSQQANGYLKDLGFECETRFHKVFAYPLILGRGRENFNTFTKMFPVFWQVSFFIKQ